MNINEIAKLAGVSRATVSRYLNNGYVSEEKKNVIRKVIEETGYQPSSQAQMLRTKRTKLVGVILPKINSDTISREVAGISDVLKKRGYQMILANTNNDIEEELKYLSLVILPKINSDTISREVAGISDVLKKRGYQMILANTNNDIEEELKYLSLFKDNQVDGVIFIATIFTGRHKKLLKECKVPVVILGQRLSGYPCIYQDDYSAMKTMGEMLLETGEKVGYITVTDKDEAVGQRRWKGFLDALEEKGMELPKEQVAVGKFTTGEKVGYITVTDKDEAVGQRRWKGFLDALEEKGMELPKEQVAVGKFTIESGYEAAKELFGKNSDIDTLSRAMKRQKNFLEKIPILIRCFAQQIRWQWVQ